MHATDVWEGRSPGAWAARLALSPVSVLYALGWEAYLGVYRLGFKRAKHPHRPILCVGNLMVGGSGKSPVTHFLASALQELGREVVIGCSGYGSPRAEGASLAPDGPLSPREWGDEPAMFRWLLPQVPLIVGRARVRAAEICAERHPNAVLLMDDGFQHLPLKKDLSILLDPEKPRNAWCLPAGPYREPRWNRARADLVLPGKFEVRPSRCFLEPEADLGGAVSALCALGNPERFFATVRDELGLELGHRLALPDHDPLDRPGLFDPLPADLPVLVTAKDWVKLRERPDIGSRRVLVVRRDVTIEPRAEFVQWLRTKLDGI
ncbi:MAG: tetraacyldisaccharide 4'-kinase [Fimbriimonadales bacterium]